MDRRHFIGSVAALGVQGAMLQLDTQAGTPTPSPRVKRRRPSFDGFDDTLVAFISDMHISPDEYEPERLQRVVDDILRQRPLPRHVVGLGDVANLYGERRDYECARRILQPLWEAGIDVTLGLGNHDRRENFASVFPEQMARSAVEGRMACVVETPKADFVLLDSLQQGSTDLLVIHKVKPAEAYLLAVPAFVGSVVDDGSNTPYQLPIFKGHKVLGFTAFKRGVLVVS